MKPEAILQSDVLDILFENRNKAYGAYALRKNYNRRLIHSLGATFLLVGLFFLLQSINPPQDPLEGNILPPDTELTDVIIEPNQPEEKKEEVQQKQKQVVQPTIDHQVPVITNDPVETEVPDVDDLRGRVISDITNDLPPGDDDPPLETGEPSDKNKPGETVITQPEDTGPLLHADVMPSFNGDIIRFMQRNLRQPDDIDDGERVTVRVRFVVNEEGNISDIQIVQSGRRDLDEEVVRAVKKMPRWNPGMQGGRRVAVFFNMPVTFVSNAE